MFIIYTKKKEGIEYYYELLINKGHGFQLS